MALEAVVLAIKLLSVPEGPTHGELRKQARNYLSKLSEEDYEELKEEALSSEEIEKQNDEYAEKLELFRRLQFTDTEAQAYAPMRIDSPGVRRVVARRALLIKMLKRPLPPGATFYRVAKMEDSFLAGMTDEDVMKALTGVKQSHGHRRR